MAEFQIGPRNSTREENFDGFPYDDPRCYANIPPVTLEGINAWVKKARPTGDFLNAVLTNDLKRAVNHGDLENLRAIPAIVAYLYNRCPIGCWGSVENVRNWRGIDAH